MQVDQMELWTRLAATSKTVVLYGMGNGADKILRICEEKGIAVSDVFASDGFVRGQIFHGKRVLSWSEAKEKYGAENLIVLLSFGSSRPEVLELIRRVASEAELYAPDVPAFGDGVIDADFFKKNEKNIQAARALFTDDESLMIYDKVWEYKKTGRIEPLLEAVSDPDKVMHEIIRPEEISSYADLGAYTGDTVRELLFYANGAVREVWAMEPDARSFKKLSAYAEGETRAKVEPFCLGAWSHRETLCFDGSGNRNASMEVNRSASLADRKFKAVTVEGEALDTLLDGRTVDYIKYDVEGSEYEAIMGSRATIERCYPTLLVSLYHRNEDLFRLPLLLHEMFPDYQGIYLRRFGGIPAWDLNLYLTRQPRVL
ncbi:MAG: FkbM family methyltransferase [Clostridia bacterium]|nr:FkbM family methyltransferase [Clostridia bacterium]